MWGNIAIAFVLAFIITYMLTPYTIKLARKIGAIDVPKDDRRMHTNAMPKFGGPAVIIGFILATVYVLTIVVIEDAHVMYDLKNSWGKLLGMLLGIIVIGITGIVDDVKTIKPMTKLIGQLIAASIVVYSGVKIETGMLPIEIAPELSGIVSSIMTVVWIIGITNAINLIDGLDGLSSGISIISAVSLLVIFILNGSTMLSIVLITALAGALVGFLPFNQSPAKTFIGETGSNFLGFSLSIIAILGVAKTYTIAVIVMPIIVLGLPIADTLFAILRRIIKNKSLKAVFQSDKGHLHHRIVDKGMSKKHTVLFMYGISATFGMFAIIFMESGIWKALSFLLIIIAALAVGYKNLVEETENPNQRYECKECRYIYNPKYGNEKNGIAPGTQFSELSDEWECPVCGKDKSLFVQSE